jgi:hypothetical protein
VARDTESSLIVFSEKGDSESFDLEDPCLDDVRERSSDTRFDASRTACASLNRSLFGASSFTRLSTSSVSPLITGLAKRLSRSSSSSLSPLIKRSEAVKIPGGDEIRFAIRGCIKGGATALLLPCRASWAAIAPLTRPARATTRSSTSASRILDEIRSRIISLLRS